MDLTAVNELIKKNMMPIEISHIIYTHEDYI